MYSKRIKLAPTLLVFMFTRLLTPAVLFFSFCVQGNESQNRASNKLEPEISIEQYNLKIEADLFRSYSKFKSEWMTFLNNKTDIIPDNLTPAWARKATEEYLYLSGGLKAKFALASQQNNFGFTLKKPIDEPMRKAGFHRTHRSIFIDIQQMNANEWLMTFVHEVAHSLDSELIGALDIYNNEKYIIFLHQLGQKNIKLSELDMRQRQYLDNWLMAGLNRGFLAEYRAWLLTYVIYNEGLKDSTFKNITWLDQLVATKPIAENINSHILKQLSKSWSNPTAGVFSYPFVQSALLELRKKIETNPGLVKMGYIKKLVDI